MEEDGDGRTYLKVEPLHAPAIVFETGDTDPTPASSPVPTPARFEATALRYRFLAHDPADLTRVSPVKEWTAKLRLKYQLHDRGDHFEVEFRPLPRAPGIAIRYTTDGSAPIHVGAATYDGAFRVPKKTPARSVRPSPDTDPVTVLLLGDLQNSAACLASSACVPYMMCSVVWLAASCVTHAMPAPFPTWME